MIVMRRARPIVMGLIASSASIAAALAGCVFSTPSDCEHELVNCPTGSTSSTSSSSGTGGGGGDGGIPPGCIPSESNSIVDDTCGVFVSGATGDDASQGTKDKPLKTLGAALMKGNVIYACAGATPFDEALIVNQDATIYGALDCTKGWAYDASKKTQITASADMVPLTVSGAATDVTIADIIVTAVDAIADGGSSIAILVDQAELVMNRVDVLAGNGKRGLDGMTPIDPVGPADPNAPAIKGNDGKNACMDPAVLVGGLAKENTLCPAMNGGPLGGSGGIGQVNSGSAGDVQPAANVQTALGGQGQPSSDPMNMWSCAVGQGAAGTNGTPGMPGLGAKDTDLGSISAAGYTGLAGLGGSIGLPGQGGGGGGGAKGKTMCAGASGGGGGVGGCGGHGGTGGQAGGASIGILSVGGTITMMSVSIQVGIGGDGGDGGDGQLGGSGGSGGNSGLGNNTGQGLSNACDGGNGGQGGKGGRGGGGRGGHAIGIAHKGGTAPSLNGATFVKGTAGLGGFGDNSNGNSGDGAAGASVDVLLFP